MKTAEILTIILKAIALTIITAGTGSLIVGIVMGLINTDLMP